MEKKKVIKVGIIGGGFSAQVFHAPFILSNPKFKLIAFMRQSKKPVEGFESINVFDNLEDFIELESDVVIVTTPTFNHFELTKKVLEKSKNVIVEKPLTVTSEEARILDKIAIEKNKLLAVFHNRIFDGDFMTIKDLIEKGKLGRIVEFGSNFERFRKTVKPNQWREKDLPGSGNLYDLGSHLIHQSLHLFGKPSSVYCIRENLRKIENGVDDYFTILLQYAEGIVVTLKASKLSNICVRFSIHGTEGSFLKYNLDPQESQIISGMKTTDKRFGIDEINQGTLVTENFNGKIEMIAGNYGLFFENFAEAFHKNDPNHLSTTSKQAILVMEIIEAAIESSKSKKAIFL